MRAQLRPRGLTRLMPDRRRRTRIGLALGSGSARGWSHVGVIRVLEQAGIVPDVVCGTSIGALVGAVYAAGELDRFEPWIKTLTWQQVLGLMDFRMKGGGLIAGGKLVDFFRHRFDDHGIEQLPTAFGCVATDLSTGHEVWLRQGPVIDAVRASIALPGLFQPVEHDGRLLLDGGMVNPVPVSLCRAMGADIVIAVDLNWHLMLRRGWAETEADAAPEPAEADDGPAGFLDMLRHKFWPPGGTSNARALPSMLEVLSASLNIMQVRITNGRLAGEPADAIIRPRLGDIGMMDFHRAAEAIAEGERAAALALKNVEDLLS